MIWYVAIIALLNLGLGYALAIMLGAGKRQASLSCGDSSHYDDAE
jgi:hypothetical protein